MMGVDVSHCSVCGICLVLYRSYNVRLMGRFHSATNGLQLSTVDVSH